VFAQEQLPGGDVDHAADRTAALTGDVEVRRLVPSGPVVQPDAAAAAVERPWCSCFWWRTIDTMDRTTAADDRPASGPSWLRRAVVVAAAVGLFAGLAACGDDDASSDGGSASDGSGSADATLEVDSISYSDVTAPAGGTLEIDNTSGVNHTFTADDGSFDVDYDAGETVDVDVPSEPGDYPFHCNIHANMKATLTAD
jgi:plastocyanin